MSELTAGDFYQKHAQRRGLGFEKSAEAEEIYPVTEGLKSSYTKIAYRRNFNHFLDYIKIHDLQVLLEYNPKIIESFIIDYVRHLRDIEKLSHMSIRVHIAAIFHFLDMNDFDLSNRNKKKIKKFLPSDESTHDDRYYTTKEISLILSKCDERSKAIILLMASTGMRVGAIHTLKIGDLEKISKYNLYKIQVYANSKKDKYYTFCTTELKCSNVEIVPLPCLNFPFLIFSRFKIWLLDVFSVMQLIRSLNQVVTNLSHASSFVQTLPFVCHVPTAQCAP
jgi:hypothetical protein